MNKHNYNPGAANGMLIGVIALVVAVVGMAGLSVYLYMQYDEQKTNVESKISLAVSESNKELETKLEADFQKRENARTLEFASPADLGRISFMYPRGWSVYVDNDGQRGGDYKVFFHPKIVPTVSNSERFALRLVIEDKAYDRIIDGYQNDVKRGDLKSSPIKFNGHSGTRFDGAFSKDIRGSAIVFKVRDKTVTMRTDAETFLPEYENLIKTADFNS